MTSVAHHIEKLDANGAPVWVGVDAAGLWWCDQDGSVWVARRR